MGRPRWILAPALAVTAGEGHAFERVQSGNSTFQKILKEPPDGSVKMIFGGLHPQHQRRAA